MTEKRVRRFLLLLLILSVFGADRAGAEGANPFGGQTILQGSGGGSGLANQITAQTVKNPSGVQYDSQNSSSGREYKAGNAQKNGNVGQAVAIATGSALTAAGIPMLASPITSVQVAGADLLAKAALEFAQAGADGNSANKNGGQKHLLTNGNGEAVNQDSGNGPAGNSLLTPQLDQLLSKRGVNSQDFVNQLASGKLTDPADILKAAGSTAEITPDALAQGKQMAMSQFADVVAQNAAVAEPLGNEGTRKVDYDASGVAKAPAALAAGAASANSVAGTGSIASPFAASSVGSAVANSLGQGLLSNMAGGIATQGATSPAAPPVQAIIPLSADAQASVLAAAAANSLMGLRNAGSLLPPQELSLLDHMGQFFGNDGIPPNALVARSFLGQVGIQKLNARQNIFQSAHRNYRNFGKWRKEIRIAERVRSRGTKLP